MMCAAMAVQDIASSATRARPDYDPGSVLTAPEVVADRTSTQAVKQSSGLDLPHDRDNSTQGNSVAGQPCKAASVTGSSIFGGHSHNHSRQWPTGNRSSC